MRRIDIIRGVNNVHSAFSDNNFVTIFFPGQDKVEPIETMRHYQSFMRKYDTFGDAEKKILEIFGLEDIHSHSLWTRIIIDDIQNVRDITRSYYRPILFIVDHLPQVIELLKQHHIEYSHIDKTITTNTDIENKEIISLILPELDTQSSHPDRLIMSLQSIELFYKSIAVILNEKNNELSVVAIDSGSDKSFDFLGAAKVVTAVKELIVEMWDRIVYYREKKMHEKLNLIEKSLPIFDTIKKMEDSGAIEKELGGILRRDIMIGAKSFISAGALLPEFNSQSYQDPRVLMAPEKKLLTMPEQKFSSEIEKATIHETQEPNDEENDSLKNDLTAEEQALLKKLIAKQQVPTPKPKPKRGN